MRIVFCGSGEVAVLTLEALHESPHQIAAVITQPPHKAGRGGALKPTPIQGLCGSLGLSVVQCPDINEAGQVAAIGRLAPQVIVVVDFGQMVRRQVRETPQYGAVNIHASLLPELRGAAPVNWAIIRGFKRTGVTVFTIADALDAGDILLSESVAIGPEETAAELRARLARLGADLVLRTLAGLEAGTLKPRPQAPERATPAPKLTKADGVIDFSQDARAIVCRILGTWPWPGARPDFHHADRPGVRVIFARARQASTGRQNPATGGTIAEDLRINVADGRVEMLELKVAGKRLMGWKDFVNGYRVRPGDRFVGVETSVPKQ